MAHRASRRLALTARWKIHLVILFAVTAASILYGTAGDGGRLFYYIPVAWALMLAATAAGDWYVDRRGGWEESTGTGWTGHLNPLSKDR